MALTVDIDRDEVGLDGHQSYIGWGESFMRGAETLLTEKWQVLPIEQHESQPGLSLRKLGNVWRSYSLYFVCWALLFPEP